MMAPAACRSRTGSETAGNFRIETWRSDAFGHSGHSFKVLHSHGTTSHEIADHVAYVLDPNSADRILVRGCTNMSDEATCARRYFDGTTEATHVISHDPPLRNSTQLTWSPGARFLSVPAQWGLLIVNLDTGAVFDAAALLDLREPGRDIDAFNVDWSPDGALALVTVRNSLTPPPSDIETDLFVIDPDATSIRYVASRPPTRTPGAWFEWQRRGHSYDLVAAGTPIYRKARYQVPASVNY